MYVYDAIEKSRYWFWNHIYLIRIDLELSTYYLVVINYLTRKDNRHNLEMKCLTYKLNV